MPRHVLDDLPPFAFRHRSRRDRPPHPRRHGERLPRRLRGDLPPDFFNHEQFEEPPASRGAGPATAHATAVWLRDAFADPRWEIQELVAEDDLIAFHCTMSGRHVRPFATYAADGSVDEVFPPTGNSFEVTQSHWLRVQDGQVIEHWANRDDLGMAKQLGWVPPTPLYLIRMALAKRRA